jgi:hypothetical protein
LPNLLLLARGRSHKARLPSDRAWQGQVGKPFTQRTRLAFLLAGLWAIRKGIEARQREGRHAQRPDGAA